MRTATATAPTVPATVMPAPITAFQFGITCPAELISERHPQKPPMDILAQRLIAAAVAVKNLALRRFQDNPHAIRIPHSATMEARILATYDAATEDPVDFDGQAAISATQEALALGESPAILQGAFIYADPKFGPVPVHVNVDHLIRSGADTYNLVLVKPHTNFVSANPGVSVTTGKITNTEPKKDKRIMLELALKLYVVEKNGVKVDNATVTHVRRDYVHPGGYDYDINELLTDVDVDPAELRALYPEIEVQLKSLNDIITANPDGVPPHYEKCPKAKDSWGMCDARWIGTRNEIRERLTADEITDMRNIPATYNDGIKNKKKLLDLIHWLMIAAAKKDGLVVDSAGLQPYFDKIARLLKTDGAVISFLDFETILRVLPWFKGDQPNTNNTLQFSNHKFLALEDVIKAKTEAGVDHDEWVYDGGIDGDWAGQAADRILATVGASGPIIVWNDSFEISRIAEIARRLQQRGDTALAERLFALIGGDKSARFEALAQQAESGGNTLAAEKIRAVIGLDNPAKENMAEYLRRQGNTEIADTMDTIRLDTGRIVDELDMVRKYAYHPKFKGKHSIKRVISALTARSYEELDDEVNNGLEAMWALEEMLSESTPPKRRRELREKLTKYCGLDTFAPVLVLALVIMAMQAEPPESAT